MSELYPVTATVRVARFLEYLSVLPGFPVVEGFRIWKTFLCTNRRLGRLLARNFLRICTAKGNSVPEAFETNQSRMKTPMLQFIFALKA